MTTSLLWMIFLLQTVDVDDAPPELNAIAAPQAMNLDGVLDEPVWHDAVAYPFDLSRDRTERGDTLREAGTVQLAYDDDYLYVAFHLTDSDVVQESDADQQHHYQTGDVAELFLKPDGATWYWEMYVTPNAKRTAFFFPGSGRVGLPSCFQPHLPGLRVAAQSQGTLNDWHDHDTGWTAEMAVPLAELAEQGVPLTPEHPWRIFIGRYNFSRYLDGPELSMHPALSTTGFHLTSEYARLVLTPADGND